MTRKCPYCTSDMELQRQWSELKSTPLDNRTYCYFCNGCSTKKPHPPIIVYVEVTSVHDANNIMGCSVTIFQRLPETDVLRNYREYIKKRNAKRFPVAEEGPQEKDRHNPYTATFKCLACSLKPKINYRESTLKVKDPRDRIIAYQCNRDEEDAHPSIIFRVRKIFFSKMARQSAFPFSIEAYSMDYLHWEEWVQSYFAMKVKTVQSVPQQQSRSTLL